MLDGNAGIQVAVVVAAAFVLTAALETSAPVPAPVTEVDTARLPPLALPAAPGGAPLQTPVAETRVDLGGGFAARLLRGYILDGRVVTRRTYRSDGASRVSPLDLGIVWGDLADPGRAAAIDFTAVTRGVRYRAGPGAELGEDLETQVTNNHLVPATPAIHEALMAVEVGARVRLRGYLVEVTGNGIGHWRSSTRRDDNTIIGGCEIILVTGVEVLEPAA